MWIPGTLDWLQFSFQSCGWRVEGRFISHLPNMVFQNWRHHLSPTYLHFLLLPVFFFLSSRHHQSLTSYLSSHRISQNLHWLYFLNILVISLPYFLSSSSTELIYSCAVFLPPSTLCSRGLCLGWEGRLLAPWVLCFLQPLKHVAGSELHRFWGGATVLGEMSSGVLSAELHVSARLRGCVAAQATFFSQDPK